MVQQRLFDLHFKVWFRFPSDKWPLQALLNMINKNKYNANVDFSLSLSLSFFFFSFFLSFFFLVSKEIFLQQNPPSACFRNPSQVLPAGLTDSRMRWAAQFPLHRSTNIDSLWWSRSDSPTSFTHLRIAIAGPCLLLMYAKMWLYDGAVAGAGKIHRQVSHPGGNPRRKDSHGTFRALTFDCQRMTNQRSVCESGAGLQSASPARHRTALSGGEC